MTQEGEVRIPLVEERLAVGTRTVDLGDVEVRKTVVTEQVMVPVELRHEVVEYRLIDDPGGVATIGEASGDLKDDTIRIPVFRETPVVHKEIVVTSEIVIDRTLATERQTLEGKLRRATVTVNDNTAPWEPVRRNRNLGEEDNEEATQ
ncbi:MAG TPA: YsnF/AvaK domain-containing protein [Chloroflexota bacterium]|nr:YsnF/AvaK domain-containing protein [Chloroflexota bacterium]